MKTQANANKCEDCGQVAVVGLNGAWLCLVDFNNRLAKVGEQMKRLADLLRGRGRKE